MTDIERKELETRRQYAIRQFACSQASAALMTAKGDERSLRYAENHIRAMRECNDCIDDLTRRLEGLK
jgi:hypothetical protein